MLIHKIKDIDISYLMSRNVFTNDINLVKGNTAIKNSIKNLLLTTRGERPFKPDVGSILSESLFELASSSVITEIKNSIYQVLLEYEKRIENIKITVILDIKNPRNLLTNIKYKNIGQDEIQTLDIIL